MPSERQKVVVQQSFPTERLDVFLVRSLPNVSRGAIQRLIEQGCVLVNGRLVKRTHHPRAGEEIEIHWPEPTPSVAQPEDIPLSVLYEDEDILVIDKPAGLVVHPAAGNEEHTLVNALLHHCQGKLSGIGGVIRPGIVHRLDKDTTGCLVVAKNDAAHVKLAAQFAQRNVHKVYDALVCGEVPPASGGIRAAIARHPSHRKRMAVVQGTGRDAWTTYRIVERLAAATWVQAEPHTGRTHQIRVHFHFIGFPVVGDPIYGKRLNLRLAELTNYKAPRQMLHAAKLAFTHPRTGEEMVLESQLPDDFRRALAALRRVI